MSTIKNHINTYADLTAYNADTNKDYSNISYIQGTDEVIFGSDIIVAKFDINNTTSNTYIMRYDKQSLFEKIWIDGVEQQNLSYLYQFTTTGEHIVKYKLVDPTTIAENTFMSVDRMVSVDIPISVTTIEQSAFDSCIGLTSVTIPNSVTSIGSGAFNGSTGLTSVTIPSSVTSIGGSAFSGCTNLFTVSIDCDELLSQDVYANSNIKRFFGTQVKNYIIGNSVTTIGNNMFNALSAIETLTFGNGLTTIGENAFQDCTGLTSVNIPNSVTTINLSAFYKCGLTTLTLGNSVANIYRSAFRNNPNLTNITSLNNVPPTLVNYSKNYPVFDLNISGRSIYVPSTSVNSYKSTTGWAALANDIVAIP